MPDADSSQDTTLSAAHLAAIEALIAGKTHAEAAAAAGVHRNTISGWLRERIDFQARLNQERRQLREQVSARLTRLAEKAATAVEHNLDDDNGGVGIALLTGLGLLTRKPPSIGSGEPAELKAELEEEERWRQFRRAPR